MSVEQNEVNNNINTEYNYKISNLVNKKNKSLSNKIIKNNEKGGLNEFLFPNEIENSGGNISEENSLYGSNIISSTVFSSSKIDKSGFNNFFRIESVIEDKNSYDNYSSSSEIIKNLEEAEKEKVTNDATNEENINKENEKKKTKQFIIATQKGRKREGQKPGNHNKFSADNLRRKIKHLVIKNVINMINKKLQKMYDGSIGYNLNNTKFLTFNRSQKFNATIEYNKAFLNKSIGEILSEPISKKYKSFPSDFNEKLVEKLKNLKDIDKKNYFMKLFNLTFLNCLQHYRGTNTFEELVGMKCFDEEKNIFKEEDYIDVLKYNLDKYEEKINAVKRRQKRLK